MTSPCSNCGRTESVERFGLRQGFAIPLCKECQNVFWKWHTASVWSDLDEIWGTMECMSLDITLGDIVDWINAGCPGDKNLIPSKAFLQWVEEGKP